MRPHRFEDGETLRVLALSGEDVGDAVIVEFGDLERPGLVHVAVVYRGAAHPGLSVGDECLIRFRAGQNRANPARWDFVGKCVEAALGA